MDFYPWWNVGYDVSDTIAQFFKYTYIYITLHEADKRVLFLPEERIVRLSIFDGDNVKYRLNKEIYGGRFFNFVDD